ncbi:hypothetical protein Athai_07170 [Actinocatenispora thailandica]|uniref:DUF3472 domain-containing protein n=1 Tax=Actinocatenispora thailandica TaxID=227318 RepID=A0A7R7HVS6_9ACTN|nr:DUF3472 domain-containing protein [Actinocatenispora thailandica]BCJ33214.1 hypothetical protein Athai_07170 [Actinocatenispora thailandica]
MHRLGTVPRPGTTLRLRPLLRCALAILLAASGLVAASSPAAAVAADPHYNWHSTAADMYNVDQTIRITATATDRFFAHQIAQSGTGAALYVGLQDNANAPQHRLVFSVWNAVGGTASAGASCHAFDSEGSGWTCVRDFGWQIGTTYTLRVWQTAKSADGSVTWLGEVYDPATSSWQQAGQITSAPGADGLSYSSNWIESFARPTGSCDTEPAAAAVFGYPVGNDGSAPGTPNYGADGTCGDHHSTEVLDTQARTVTLTQ